MSSATTKIPAYALPSATYSLPFFFPPTANPSMFCASRVLFPVKPESFTGVKELLLAIRAFLYQPSSLGLTFCIKSELRRQ
jgi:hypothetical protein